MEPVTAVGAAKAIGAAASAANSMAKNSLVHALLLPSAKAYGDHWAERVREKLTSASIEKKRENIREHLEAVYRSSDADFHPDPSLSQDWMNHAGEIDPVDKELSAAWRGVLLAIGSGDIYRKQLLDVIKSLTPEDARIYTNICASITSSKIRDKLNRIFPMRSTKYEYKRNLMNIGLLRRPIDVFIGQSLVTLALAIVCALIVLCVPTLTELSTNSKISDLYMPWQAMLNLLFIVFSVALVGEILSAMRVPRLTLLGIALHRVMVQVASASEPDEGANEIAEPSATPGGASAPTRKPRRDSKGRSSKGVAQA